MRWILFIMLWATVASAQQPIGGVVNQYTAVRQIRASKNQLRVDDASAFAIGDRVLIIQMQGAVMDTVVGPSYGALQAYRHAGRFERNVIDSINGTLITLRNVMSQAYATEGAVQLVRIPHWTSARVTSTITCEPWNGTTGGVLVIAVRDTLYLDANVDVSGKGFRGGRYGAATMFTSGLPTWASNDSASGTERGEGIAGSPYRLGCAAAVSGGGGGQTEVHGGGGGSNAGCGGTGADVVSWWGNHAVGVGGQQLSYQTGYNRIFMGGGGGAAPRRSVAEAQAAGGDGGGIAVIDAPTIIGTAGAVLRANGTDGQGSRAAGSGGGGGGLLLVTATRLVNVPVLETKGGAGGTPLSYGMPLCQGPGGGGGGGVIMLGTLNPLNLNPSAYVGGEAGQQQGVDSCKKILADAGCYGTVVYNARINEDTTKFRQPTLVVRSDTAVCAGTPIVLYGRGTVPLQWWRNGQQLCSTCDSLSVVADTSTVYTARAQYADGSADSADVVVTVYPLPVVRLDDPPAFCPGDAVMIKAPSGFAAYRWSTGDTTSSIVVRTPGMYTLDVVDSNGCPATASATARYQSLTVITVDASHADSTILAIPSAMVYDTSPLIIDVRSVADTPVVVHRATLQRGIEISAPLSQFPFTIAPRASMPLTVVGMATVPTDVFDTLHIQSGCGVLDVRLRMHAYETPAFTRCAVRLTGTGERDHMLPPLLIDDMYTVAMPHDVRSPVRWSVIDACGRVMHQGETALSAEHVLTIDLSTLPEGIYGITVQWDSGRAAGAFVTP